MQRCPSQTFTVDKEKVNLYETESECECVLGGAQGGTRRKSEEDNEEDKL